jgi:5-methylcytosine-specific restriction protein A
MPLGDLNSREAVLQAIEEYDQLGEEAFLEQYGFGPARSYFLIHKGRRYPSKAIAGVAHGYQYPQKGPLTSAEFAGGDATVKAKLESLDFKVTSPDDGSRGEPVSSRRNPPWTRDELILALDLYIRSGRRVLSEDHPDVIALSDLLNQLPIHKEREAKFRNPNGVAMKLANFRALDPAAEGKHGLSRGNSLEPKIWNKFADNQKLLRETAEAIAQNAKANQDNDPDEEIDLDEEFAEGRTLTRAHRTRERSGKAVAQRKKMAGDRPRCEVCQFDFLDFYGEVGRGFIECHHTKHVSQLRPGQTTKIRDLALVCANCHRMLHREQGLTIEELRQRLQINRDEP